MRPLAVAVGWLGAAALLLGYVQTSLGRWPGRGAAFQWCSVAGSAGLGLAAVDAGVWPSVVLNVVWLAVGLAALSRSGLTARGRTVRGRTVQGRTARAPVGEGRERVRRRAGPS